MQSEEAEKVLQNLLNSTIYKDYVLNSTPNYQDDDCDIPKLKAFEEPVCSAVKKRNTTRKWLRHEEKLLMELTKQYYDIDWEHVAQQINATFYGTTQCSVLDCKQRWKRLITGSVKFSSKDN